MKIGEKIKGNNLRNAWQEGDLIQKLDNKHSIHIVFNSNICRPSIIDGDDLRGEISWTKVGSCIDYCDFEITYDSYCKDCRNRLAKLGYQQNK
jgi:hypothetical protein